MSEQSMPPEPGLYAMANALPPLADGASVPRATQMIAYYEPSVLTERTDAALKQTPEQPLPDDDFKLWQDLATAGMAPQPEASVAADIQVERNRLAGPLRGIAMGAGALALSALALFGARTGESHVETSPGPQPTMSSEMTWSSDANLAIDAIAIVAGYAGGLTGGRKAAEMTEDRFVRTRARATIWRANFRARRQRSHRTAQPSV